MAAAHAAAIFSNPSVRYTKRMLSRRMYFAASSPSAPLSFDGTPGNTEVSLTWSAPANDGRRPITGYKIYRDTSSPATTLIDTLGTVLSYDDTGLTYGNQYYYRVRAFNVIGDGDFSSEVTVTPLTPLTPTYYGWFGGGAEDDGSDYRSNINRIDYANDTVTAPFRGSLSVARNSLAATGNSSYGWFGGGFSESDFHSNVDRIDYANDTAIASVRGPLSLARHALAAAGTSSYGWFSGGSEDNDSNHRTTVDRIDYTNDTLTTSVRGPLSLARGRLTATGTSSYGWFGGGNGPVSTVDRIDYATDTATASVRGPLSLARFGLATTGTSSYGWFGGGHNDPTQYSTIDRIDYTTDTATASVRSSLSLARHGLAAAGTSSYGWFGGGYSSPSYSNVDRIDYATDTTTASVRGPLLVGRNYLAATQNSPLA